ncbi:MAG: hypothetical protein JW928_09875 [Candidatus Aureabacteria bacterium]|nr:hypothetical protein [Candidatus Auribacterota bacterium]
MKRLLIIVCLVWLVFSFTDRLYAQGKNTGNFGISLEYWMTNFEGEAKSSGGTEVKLNDDINVNDDDNTLRWNFTMPVTDGSALDLSYYTLSYSGAQVLTKNITFNDVVFSSGELTSGKAEADIFDIKFKLFPLMTADAQLGFILGMKWAQAEASLSSASSGTQKASVDVPLPQVGLALSTEMQYVKLSAELSGFALSISDTSGSMLEFDVRGEYDFLPNAGVIGGYRYDRIDVEQDDDSADFTIKGIYLGGIVRF